MRAVLDSPAWTPAICQRCQGAYDSVLHAICEYEQQARELAEGGRDRITCPKPSMHLCDISAGYRGRSVPELVSR